MTNAPEVFETGNPEIVFKPGDRAIYMVFYEKDDDFVLGITAGTVTKVVTDRSTPYVTIDRDNNQGEGAFELTPGKVKEVKDYDKTIYSLLYPEELTREAKECLLNHLQKKARDVDTHAAGLQAKLYGNLSGVGFISDEKLDLILKCARMARPKTTIAINLSATFLAMPSGEVANEYIRSIVKRSLLNHGYENMAGRFVEMAKDLDSIAPLIVLASNYVTINIDASSEPNPKEAANA